MMTPASRIGAVKLAFSLLLAMAAWTAHNRLSQADPSPADTSPTKADSKIGAPRAALVLAFRTNLDYCRQWAAAKDFKSLGQSAGALSVLAGAIGRHTAEAGQDDFKVLRKAVDDLTAASKSGDGAQAAKVLEAMPGVVDVVAATAVTESPKAAGKTAAGFTPLMFLIDGTFVDAKTALATGDAATAKTYAVVLADLGQWLAADRTGDQWHTQAGDLTSAAQAAAAAETNDPKALRATFHEIYARCDACHHRNR